MIDAQNDPAAVAAFFSGHGVARFCYGNGTSFPVSDEGAMVYRTPVEQACWMRVTRNAPRFVYAWTVNSIENQRLYLHLGVNGIIADPSGIAHFGALLRDARLASKYRLARRSDNPFLPLNAFYGLTVTTNDIAMAGTDANITFTVTGENGSSSTTMDSRYNSRMERDSANKVVLPSPDLGELHSVTVQRDDSGNAPDWHVASIKVESMRYKRHGTASFDCWIDSTAPVTRPLA